MNPFYLFLFYVAIYMGNALYGVFFPVYLHNSGLTAAQIGVLFSIGPIAAIIGQPIWGILGDKSRSKNRVLQILLVGSALFMLLIPANQLFYYTFVMIALFTVFQTSIFPISDAISLEELDKSKKWSFGIVRMGGTIGYALMAVAFGLLAGDRIDALFAVYAGTMMAALLLTWRFPAGASFQSVKMLNNVWSLFRHRKLMMYLGYSFAIQITYGFYYAFFPIYYTELGGTSSLLGWTMFISAFSEVPFLLFSGAILKRIPLGAVLSFAGVASCLRWLLISQISSPYWMLPVQILHGGMFIVLTVAMATYINHTVSPEWKASGQALHGLISLGAARIAGSLLGGIFIEYYGISRLFLFGALFSVGCTAAFALVLWRTKREAMGAAVTSNKT